jgi:uncharacterized protein (DUF58 family)
MGPAPWWKHVLRIATLIVPSAVAWSVAFFAQHHDELANVVTQALGPLWVALTAALVARIATAVVRRKPGLLARIDVLSASGAALAWLSALAIIGAVWLGWASLAAVGLLGTGLFHVVVLYGFIVLGDPLRKGSLVRRFSPELVTEGDELIEELHLADVHVPTGFRLFVTGRIGPRWATSRYVVEAAESGGELVLESQVGPAVRGEHTAEPLVVWLSDTFGICRSVPIFVEPTCVTVLPRVRPAEAPVPLLDRGMGPRTPRADPRIPTEGSFRLREYQDGDDVRRIHWVRSLAAGELIVRLPDELPPDRPRVRVVLDTFFPEAFALSCAAPAEMLDSLVAAWLAVGRALSTSGARVTLVSAVPRPFRGEGHLDVARHELSARDLAPALRLGARVAWQTRMPVESLLTDEATFVVSRAILTSPPPHGTAGSTHRWILVTPTLSPEPIRPSPASLQFAHPMGSSDNRGPRRRRVADDIARAHQDHARAMLTMGTSIVRPPPGTLVAFPTHAGGLRLSVLP